MMKRLLVIVLLACLSTVKAQFASIGIIGSATPTAWDSDSDMVTTDGVVYTLSNFTLTGGQVKFRKDNLWTENWGGTAFPSGTAVANGSNLNVVAGVYNISFNLTTLQYSFVDMSGFQNISLSGVFNGWTDLPMGTTDGIHYSLKCKTLSSGDVKFKSTGSWASNWGGNTFPSGTGVPNGLNIILPGGIYNVDFNLQTLEYSFSYVNISMIGTALQGWSTDVPMTTSDGVHYALAYEFVPGGAYKFRANANWDNNWGGPLDGNLAVVSGADIVIPSTYVVHGISFNIQTREVSMAILETEKYAFSQLRVYPNPAQSTWNFDMGGTELSVVITDITGKEVYRSSFSKVSASVNAESFSPGIYFAKVTSGKESTTIKLVKK